MDRKARIERNALMYRKARLGELDYAEVRDSQDAEWAANGLREGVKFGNLKGDDANWAYDFLANLDADFG